MPRGVGNFPERGEGGNNRYLWLTDDGESAKIRFLTDGDEIYWEWFHRLEDSRGNYQGEKICKRSALDERCEYCDTNIKSVFQWLAWVFVYYVDRTEPGQGRSPITVGRTKMYREKVGEARLMRLAGTHAASVKLRFDKLGTLLDHEFEWNRSGPKKTKRPVYTLDVLDKVKMPRELVVLAGEMADLEDVAFDRAPAVEKVTKRARADDDDEEEPFPEETTKAKRRAAPEPEEDEPEEAPAAKKKRRAETEPEPDDEKPDDDDSNSPF